MATIVSLAAQCSPRALSCPHQHGWQHVPVSFDRFSVVFLKEEEVWQAASEGWVAERLAESGAGGAAGRSRGLAHQVGEEGGLSVFGSLFIAQTTSRAPRQAASSFACSRLSPRHVI